MAKYVYKCAKCEQIKEVEHGMMEDPLVVCDRGYIMHRVPQPFLVNWNGLKPSQGEIDPQLLARLNDAPRQRELLAAHKEGNKNG